MGSKIIYLAGPYSHPDPKVRLARFNAVTLAAAKLIERKLIVFSPLTMTHPIDLVLAENGNTLGSDYWVKFDEAFMKFCSEMWILKIDGWDESRGVDREIKYFRSQGRPVMFLNPDTFETKPYTTA